jgi:hypothetical protein
MITKAIEEYVRRIVKLEEALEQKDKQVLMYKQCNDNIQEDMNECEARNSLLVEANAALTKQIVDMKEKNKLSCGKSIVIEFIYLFNSNFIRNNKDQFITSTMNMFSLSHKEAKELVENGIDE